MTLHKSEEFERRSEPTPAVAQKSVQSSIAEIGVLAAALSVDMRREAVRLDGERREPNVAWASLTELKVDAGLARKAALVTVDRGDRAHTAFDILRTNVVQETAPRNWRRIGITAPRRGCGASLVALNLAFSLQHHADLRTVLMDMDLARPHLAATLGTTIGLRRMGDFLKGSIEPENMLRRYGGNLALGLNREAVEHPAELLQSANAAGSLARMIDKLSPNVVLYDLPPVLDSDEVSAFASNLDCVLIVARAEKSRMDEIDVCERTLAERTNVLGIVLNDCRYMPEKYGY